MGKILLVTILLGLIVLLLNYASYYGAYHVETKLSDFADKRCMLKYQRKNQKD